MPIITTLSALDVDALVQILTEPKNALVKQYKKLFEMDDASLKFTDGALKALADKAIERDTGARALRAIMEELMIELMYRLPEEPKPGNYVITKEVVEGEADLFGTAEETKKESA
jgi:ATP-dependent Clp protease ATP-binding subunit ClpX